MPTPPTELVATLRAEAMRIEEDCTYNYMGHYQAASRWGKVDYLLGFPVAILSGITAFTVFSLPTLATALGIATTMLSLVILYLRPSQTAALHYRSGGKFKALREKARLFREIELLASKVDEAHLTRRIRELSEEKRVLSELGVPLPDFAYKIAKRKILNGHTSYEVDQPIKLLEP